MLEVNEFAANTWSKFQIWWFKIKALKHDQVHLKLTMSRCYIIVWDNKMSEKKYNVVIIEDTKKLYAINSFISVTQITLKHVQPR